LAALDSSEVVATLEAGQPVRVELSNGPQELSSDEVEVRVRPQEGFAVSRAGFGAVALDVTITEELRIRGLTRDVIRQVQELRRHVGLEVDDRVRLTLAGVDEIRPRSDEVAEAVLAVELTFGIGASEGTPLAFDDARPATAWLSKA
jgi:isoleucyl-tRNA synthetase